MYFRSLYNAPVPPCIKVGALRAAMAGTSPIPSSAEVHPDGDEVEYTLDFGGIPATERRRELVRRTPDWDEHVNRQIDWLRMVAGVIEIARGRRPYLVLLRIIGVLAATLVRLRAEHVAILYERLTASLRIRGVVPLMASIDVHDVLSAPRPGPLLAFARP